MKLSIDWRLLHAGYCISVGSKLGLAFTEQCYMGQTSGSLRGLGVKIRCALTCPYERILAEE